METINTLSNNNVVSANPALANLTPSEQALVSEITKPRVVAAPKEKRTMPQTKAGIVQKKAKPVETVIPAKIEPTSSETIEVSATIQVRIDAFEDSFLASYIITTIINGVADEGLFFERKSDVEKFVSELKGVQSSMNTAKNLVDMTGLHKGFNPDFSGIVLFDKEAKDNWVFGSAQEAIDLLFPAPVVKIEERPVAEAPKVEKPSFMSTLDYLDSLDNEDPIVAKPEVKEPASEDASSLINSLL